VSAARRVLAETVVDLGAVADNVRTIGALVAPAGVMVVVKADAYNHGMLDVARTAVNAGAAALGVATIAEALTLRDAGIDAPVSAWIWLADEEDLPAVIDRDITLGVPSLAHLDAAVAAAKRAGRPAKVFLMVDTGLSRSGIMPMLRWTPDTSTFSVCVPTWLVLTIRRRRLLIFRRRGSPTGSRNVVPEVSTYR